MGAPTILRLVPAFGTGGSAGFRRVLPDPRPEVLVGVVDMREGAGVLAMTVSPSPQISAGGHTIPPLGEAGASASDGTTCSATSACAKGVEAASDETINNATSVCAKGVASAFDETINDAINDNHVSRSRGSVVRNPSGEGIHRLVYVA